MKHLVQQWRIFAAAALMVFAVWNANRSIASLILLFMAIGLFIWDGIEFRREQAEYERQSDASLERLRAHCTTPPHGEEED